MSLGLQLIMTTALATTAPGCSWAHPGANPYRGDPVHALADFSLPDATRTRLRALMIAHRYTDVATISRDDIVGAQGYTDLREMHSGGGQLCKGRVDRSAWAADRRERGLVYCVDDACVIVPTICNNVALVSRKPAQAAQAPPDEAPIDIAPAAGPPPPQEVAVAPAPESGLSQFLAPGDGGGTGGSGAPGLAGGGTGSPGSPLGGGDIPCCSGPVGPAGPPPVTPTSPVPELPASMAWLAGLAALWRATTARASARP